MTTKKQKKRYQQDGRAFIAVSTNVRDAVKEYAEKNGMLIGGFFERAAMEKLERELKSKSK